MKHAAAKIEYKQLRMDNAQKMLTTFNDDPNLLKKSHNWVYGYDIETNAQCANHFATTEEIKVKSKQERVSKNIGSSVLNLRGVSLKGDKIVLLINK